MLCHVVFARHADAPQRPPADALALLEAAGHEIGGWTQATVRDSCTSLLRAECAVFVRGFGADPSARRDRHFADSLELPFLAADPSSGFLRPEVWVGISGYARSGKDTALGHLSRAHGFVEAKFRQPIALAGAVLDPFVRVGADGTAERYSAVVAAHGFEAAKAIPEVRRVLQALGDEAVPGVLGRDVWAEDALQRELTPPDGPMVSRFGFSDLRLRTQFDALRRRHGLHVRVVRSGTSPALGHRGETALDDAPADLVLVNDGTLRDLTERIDAWIEEVLPAKEAM